MKWIACQWDELLTQFVTISVIAGYCSLWPQLYLQSPSSLGQEYVVLTSDMYAIVILKLMGKTYLFSGNKRYIFFYATLKIKITENCAGVMLLD